MQQIVCQNIHIFYLVDDQKFIFCVLVFIPILVNYTKVLTYIWKTLLILRFSLTLDFFYESIMELSIDSELNTNNYISNVEK